MLHIPVCFFQSILDIMNLTFQVIIELTLIVVVTLQSIQLFLEIIDLALLAGQPLGQLLRLRAGLALEIGAL